MTYEQATKDLGVTEVTGDAVAEAALLVHSGETTTEEVFVTDEGIVGEAPADVTLH